MDATQLLQNSLNPDANIRGEATRTLENVERDNYPGYAQTLAGLLALESAPLHIRQAAGLALKNSVSARDPANQQRLTDRWLELAQDAARTVKGALLSALGSSEHNAGAAAAQCVSSVAAIEMPDSRWPELLPTLIEFSARDDNIPLRINTLRTIGFMCEIVPPECLAGAGNQILTAIVRGARKEEPNDGVQAVALRALHNSLDFIRANFENEGERNYIMQMLCEACMHPSVPVEVSAFECLVKVVSTYYDKMAMYMDQAVLGLTITGMKHPSDEVALQAIEFWSSLCETEIDLVLDAQEAHEYGEPVTTESKHYARGVMPQVLVNILPLLTTTKEDDDEDDWTRAMAAGACLELMARDIGDPIIQPVANFVESRIRDPQWQNREAAVMAFGSILDGPETTKLASLVTQAFGELISMLSNDESVKVRETVAWTFTKITETMMGVIPAEMYLSEIVNALVLALKNEGDTHSTRVQSHCCAALETLVSVYAKDEPTSSIPHPTNDMSPFYGPILQELMTLSQRTDNEGNIRTAAYQTICSFVAGSAEATIPIVNQVAEVMLKRQEELIAHVQETDRNNWTDIQINICVVLQTLIHRAPGSVNNPQVATRIITNLFEVLSICGENSSAFEDIFSTVGALAGAMESEFVQFMGAFTPFLYRALGTLVDWQVCQAGVFVTSDIVRALGERIIPYAQQIMEGLLTILKSPAIRRNVKPNAVSAVGDVALATGSSFPPYLQMTMEILSQAGTVEADDSDVAGQDFVWAMREALVDAFVGILNGLKSSPESTGAFQPYVNAIMGFLRQGWDDEDKTDQFCSSSLGLIGDFGDTYKAAVSNDLMQDWIQQAISYGRQRDASRSAKTNASYAQRAIRDLSR